MTLRDEILSRVQAKAGGNSNRGLKEVASDLVNSLEMTDGQIADLTFLSVTTVARLRSLDDAESGADYSPQAQTLERVFRACGAEISLTPVTIQSKYRNKEK